MLHLFIYFIEITVLQNLHSFLMLIINVFPFLFVLERDAFDALFDNAPEKLNVVKKVLVTYMYSS